MGKKDDESREGTGELPFLSKKVSTQTKPKDMSEVNTNADKKKTQTQTWSTIEVLNYWRGDVGRKSSRNHYLSERKKMQLQSSVKNMSTEAI